MHISTFHYKLEPSNVNCVIQKDCGEIFIQYKSREPHIMDGVNKQYLAVKKVK